MSDKIPIVIREVVQLNDPEYFCNKSWTVSYNVNTKSWISFHTYIPNFYIAENNFFYSGLNSCCDDDISLDVISTIVTPPEPTTTTTTTKGTTTTTTTAKPLECGLEGTYIINDCSMEGTAIDISVQCGCYSLYNTTEDLMQYSYTPCLGSSPITATLAGGSVIGICAKLGSVTANIGIDVIPGGVCSDSGDCTITPTTTNTTTVCPTCKTYTLTNNTSSLKTATQLVDCVTGLLYTFTIPANSTLHACSCNAPTVPTGLTSVEFGSGCTRCFCYTITNIEGVSRDVTYTACDGTQTTDSVGAYSHIYICAIEGQLNAGSMDVTVSNTGCADSAECDCWDC